MAEKPLDLSPLLEELTALLQWAWHDGWFDVDKPVWEQDVPEIKAVWERITRPYNAESLRERRGTAGNEDWNQIFAEAYR